MMRNPRAPREEPTPEAVYATHAYEMEYLIGDKTVMEFWRSLDPARQRICEHATSQILRAWRKRQPKASRL